MSNARNISDIFSKSTAISTDTEVSTAVVAERTTVATLTGKTLTAPSVTNTLISTTSTSTVPLTIKAISSQSADLFQVQPQASSTPIFKIDINGNITSSGTSATFGNLGVNTTSLTVAGGYGSITLDGTTGSILSSRANGTEVFRIQTAGGSSTIVNQIANNPLLFATNNTERMRIDQSGNMIINTGNLTLTSGGIVLTAGSITNSPNTQYQIANSGNGGGRFFRQIVTNAKVAAAGTTDSPAGYYVGRTGLGVTTINIYMSGGYGEAGAEYKFSRSWSGTPTISSINGVNFANFQSPMTFHYVTVDSNSWDIFVRFQQSAGVPSGTTMTLTFDMYGQNNSPGPYQASGVTVPTLSTTNQMYPMTMIDQVYGNTFSNLQRNAYSGNQTATINELGKLLDFSVAATFTIPANSSTYFPVGTTFMIYQSGTGQVTVSAPTLVSYQSKTKTAGQYAVATVMQTAADVWLLFGNLG
jgi:hypothetical protein